MNEAEKYGNLMISEVWDLMLKCQSAQELYKIISLQNSKSFALILRAHFMDKTSFKINQIPIYERNTAPEGLAETNLRVEAERLYGILFGNTSTNDVRRSILLSELLSGIDRKDAYLVEHIIESEPGSDFKKLSHNMKEWVMEQTAKFVPTNI